MGDMISRSALIKNIREISTSLLNEWDTAGVMSVVYKQPTVGAIPVDRWVPCSERLPEEDGEYLTWIRYDGHEFMSIEDFECSGLLAQWNFEGRNDDEVIAWMPLPDPYKGE